MKPLDLLQLVGGFYAVSVALSTTAHGMGSP
jgi:hypothetical protein